MNPNLHHVELFYYAARHGGLTEASRRMPYGIAPSTISKQLCQLEKDIAVTLYERHPFKLTKPGAKLFAFIRPLLEDLPGVIDHLRQDVPDLVRLGASPVVLREYMPSMVQTMRQGFPQLRLALSEGLQWQIEEWLKDKRIDLAVTLLDGELPDGCSCEPLMQLPMVLLAPRNSKLRSAAELWRKVKIGEPLICPMPGNAISRSFLQRLKRQGVEWPIGMEANSIELVEAYVRKGLGIGLSVAVPGRSAPKGVRALPLSSFPKIELGMIWQKNPNAATKHLIQELRREAKRLGAR